MNALNPSAFDENTHEHNDAEGCRHIWQAVLHRAFIDATHDGPQKAEKFAQREAHSWITNCGKDFRQVCDLAGMDADFLSHAYKSGRVDKHLLKGTEDSRRGDRLPTGQVSEMVLKSITGEMTTRQIADYMLSQGVNLTTNQIGWCLRGSLRRSGKVTSRNVGGVNLWAKGAGA